MSAGMPIQPRDPLGRFMLPQAPEEAGYYVYGNVRGVPNTGHLAQYADHKLMSMIFWLDREWQAVDDRKFGIGNISIASGIRYEHSTHMKGIEMDVRPVREDGMVGQSARCSYQDAAVYDCDATIKLVRLFLQYPTAKLVYFNDDKVQRACGGRVTSCHGHNDHLHFEIAERP